MHRRALKEEPHRMGGAFRLIREDVNPPRLGDGLLRTIILCLALVTVVSVAFTIINHAALWLVPATLLPTLMVGFALHFWLGYVDHLWGWLTSRIGRLHASFLLFFVYLPTFVALYFLILAYPVGVALSSYASPELAADYRRWILDGSAIAALIAWGGMIRSKL